MLVVLFMVIMVVFAYSAFSKFSPNSALSGMTSAKENQIGIVELEGEISTSKDFREKLFKFVKNSSIKGIVVRIDSPGGAVGASEEIYRYILEARKTKPVVCSLGNMAASGGLYSAMGCEKIYTAAGTMSGSIGVIMMMPNFKAVMDKVGVGFTIVKTGQFKDAGSPFREVTEPDKEYLQSVAQTAFAQFINAIATARNLPEESVKAIADGRIILGEDAVKLGIADKIGTVYDAAQEVLILAVGEEAKDKEPYLVFPSKELSFPDFIKSLPQQTKAFIEGLSTQNTSIKFQMM